MSQRLGNSILGAAGISAALALGLVAKDVVEIGRAIFPWEPVPDSMLSGLQIEWAGVALRVCFATLPAVACAIVLLMRRFSMRWLAISATILSLSLACLAYMAVALGFRLSAAAAARPDAVWNPADVRPLAAYQNLAPGTPITVVLRIGTIGNGMQRDSTLPPMEIEGTLALITKDTVFVAEKRNGGQRSMGYAGRMVHEIRVRQGGPNHAADRMPGTSAPGENGRH